MNEYEHLWIRRSGDEFMGVDFAINIAALEELSNLKIFINNGGHG